MVWLFPWQFVALRIDFLSQRVYLRPERLMFRDFPNQESPCQDITFHDAFRRQNIGVPPPVSGARTVPKPDETFPDKFGEQGMNAAVADADSLRQFALRAVRILLQKPEDTEPRIFQRFGFSVWHQVPWEKATALAVTYVTAVKVTESLMIRP